MRKTKLNVIGRLGARPQAWELNIYIFICWIRVHEGAVYDEEGSRRDDGEDGQREVHPPQPPATPHAPLRDYDENQ